MVAIGRLLVQWLGSLNPMKFASVKAVASKTFNIPSTLGKSEFMSALSAHLAKYPVSYATLLGGLSSYSNEIIEYATGSNSLSGEELSTINQIIGSNDPSKSIVSYDGGDGDANTVNGVDSDEFSRNVDLVEGARRNVQEIANILGVPPLAAIELSMRLAVVEPQHAQLFR